MSGNLLAAMIKVDFKLELEVRQPAGHNLHASKDDATSNLSLKWDSPANHKTANTKRYYNSQSEY